jgi:nitronate monooxygenase
MTTDKMETPRSRARAFCDRFGVRVPILLAPMAGACPPSLSIAMMQAGSMGACGALLFQPEEIKRWAAEVRAASDGPFQINLWIPDPAPVRDREHEARVRELLERWGPSVPPTAGDSRPPDFARRCQAILDACPAAVSSIMGLYPPEFVAELKARGIPWLATATTVAEAKLAEAAGADVIVAQGMEAGGHRGAFDAREAERKQVGLVALVPAIVDAVGVPVIAAGGIADQRGVAAALALGASAVMIGTAFLRCPEAQLHPAWADALSQTAPEETTLTRAFSGRAGRAIVTDYVRAAADPAAPEPCPYPVQRGVTGPMRKQAQQTGNLHAMQAWAGQSAALAQKRPAGELLTQIWAEAEALLR